MLDRLAGGDVRAARKEKLEMEMEMDRTRRFKERSVLRDD
jgi:hypothetical protein